MSLLINGIANLSIEEIGSSIYGKGNFNEKESEFNDFQNVYCCFINNTFYLSDYKLDGQFIISATHEFVMSLFDNFGEHIEVIGFFDNDSDLPAGISIYRNRTLKRRVIRNAHGKLLADTGYKEPFEIPIIQKHIPSFTNMQQSIREFLLDNPALMDVYSENYPTWFVDEVVDIYLSQFCDQAMAYFDFYSPNTKKYARNKQVNINDEVYIPQK